MIEHKCTHCGVGIKCVCSVCRKEFWASKPADCCGGTCRKRKQRMKQKDL